MNKKIPTFFIDGFLDAGKTSFIIETIKNDGFDGNTLLFVCEEGEVEYDARMLKALYKTDIVYFDSLEKFNHQSMSKFIEEFNPDRIVIEMNGMWELDKLQFPRIIDLMQVMYFIDGRTFITYFNNMRQKMVDIIKRSNIVIFTNVKDPKAELEPWKAPLKMANSNASFFVMDENFNASDAFEEPLPYDIDAPVIRIKNDDYATYYIDTFDHKDRYQGKIVEYSAQVFKSDKLPRGAFVLGRLVMNCCANDIQLCGFVVKNSLGRELQDRSFIKIKAKLLYEYSKEYNEEEAFLDPIEIELIPSFKEEVLNLSGNL